MTNPSQTSPIPMPADPLQPLFATLPEDLRQGMTSLIRIFGFVTALSLSDPVMTLEDTGEFPQALPSKD